MLRPGDFSRRFDSLTKLAGSDPSLLDRVLGMIFRAPSVPAIYSPHPEGASITQSLGKIQDLGALKSIDQSAARTLPVLINGIKTILQRDGPGHYSAEAAQTIAGTRG